MGLASPPPPRPTGLRPWAGRAFLAFLSPHRETLARLSSPVPSNPPGLLKAQPWESGPRSPETGTTHAGVHRSVAAAHVPHVWSASPPMRHAERHRTPLSVRLALDGRKDEADS